MFIADGVCNSESGGLAAMAVIKLAWMSGVADQDKSHAVTTDASRVYLGLFSKKAELI